MKKFSDAELAASVAAHAARQAAQGGKSPMLLRDAPSTDGNKSVEEMLAAAEGSTAPAPLLSLPADLEVVADWELVEDRVLDVDVQLVDDSPFQTEDEARERYDPQLIDELAHTMAQAGQQEPIKVRYCTGRFELIAGHRRIRAARSLGWAKISALVVRCNDQEAEKSVMVHNEGRLNNSDFAKALLYDRARRKGYAKTQGEVAHMFGASQAAVSRRLAMLTLPEPILGLLHQKKDLISMNGAATVLKLAQENPDDIELLTKAVARIKDEGAAENSVAPWVAQMKQARNRQAPKPADNKPKVITDANGKHLYTAKVDGRILSIRFHAPELDPIQELEDLLEYLRTKGGNTA